MTKFDTLKYGPPGDSAVHICVDMQRMFAGQTEWTMPWLDRVLPRITALVALRPERTIFTRFIPADEPGQGAGMWRHYYDRWSSMTVSRLGREMIDIVPTLAKYAPPARVIDKHVYSPWTGTDLHLQLRGAGINTIILTGGETDVCVLSSLLGAVDWGFRVILASRSRQSRPPSSSTAGAHRKLARNSLWSALLAAAPSTGESHGTLHQRHQDARRPLRPHAARHLLCREPDREKPAGYDREGD